MKCRLGMLVWYIAAGGSTSMSSIDGACLLQLQIENGPNGLLDGKEVFGQLDGSGVDALARHESESEDLGERGRLLNLVDEPDWTVYPSELSHILETMVVTRYWGDARYQLANHVPVPGLYQKFDCVRHEAFEKTTSLCRTLLCQSRQDQIERCAREIQQNKLNVASGEFVAFFGEDEHLSGVLSTVKTIGSHFQRTYFEGYDVLDNDIDVLPIGLQEYYLRFQDFAKITQLAQQQTLPKQAKVLGAYGAFWTLENPSRQSAAKLCTSHERETWLSCEEVPRQSWWTTLSSYSFMLNPAGNGIQSPKFHEALLVGTVPICTKEPAFVKLEQKGWPLLLVNSFSEVSALNLTRKYEEFKPRLASIHKYLFLDDYWKYLQTGTCEICKDPRAFMPESIRSSQERPR